MAILMTYLGLTALVALRQGWAMLFKLDRFDWQYRSGDVWIGFWASVIAWPLWLILRPGTILRGELVGDGGNSSMGLFGHSQATQRRAVQHLIDCPPTCGAQVSYAFPNAGEGSDHVHMTFKSADIESFFKGRDLPLFWADEQVALVAFIKNRDESISGPTPIPDPIDFEHVAAELLDAGMGEIRCPRCGMPYSAAHLEQELPAMHPGWNYAQYHCPQGHQLLSRRSFHVYARSSNRV